MSSLALKHSTQSQSSRAHQETHAEYERYTYYKSKPKMWADKRMKKTTAITKGD